MGERIVASYALTLASYMKCSRLLKRGEVKRALQRGPLIGYVIGCPACGFSCSYVHEDCGSQKGVGYIEDPPTEVVVHDFKTVRKLVGMQRNPTCVRCHRTIRIRDGQLQAVEERP
jgi:hypothetical protein